MDLALNIGGLNRANREMKYFSGYIESIQKREGLFKATELAMQKNMLSSLLGQLYYIDMVARRLPKLSFGEKFITAAGQQMKDAITSNVVETTNANQQQGINRSPADALTKEGHKNDKKNEQSQSSFDISEITSFGADSKDYIDALIDSVQRFKSITIQEYSNFPNFLKNLYNSIYSGAASTSAWITSKPFFNKITSVWGSSPPWLKKSLGFVGKYFGVIDQGVSLGKISNMTGETKYEELGKFFGGEIGKSLGTAAGNSIGGMVRYAGVVLGPLLGLVLGKEGKEYGEKIGVQTGKGVWYVKENLAGWTNSLLEEIDTVNSSFKTGVDGVNIALNAKVDQLNPQAKSQLDSWISDAAVNVNNSGNPLIDAIGDFGGKLASNNPTISPLINQWTVTAQNGVRQLSNSSAEKINGLKDEAENVIDAVGNTTKKSINFGAKLFKGGADLMSGLVKWDIKVKSMGLQGILDLPENINPKEWFSSNNTDVNGTRKIGTSPTRTASSKGYRANEKHTRTATASVKNSNRTTSNTNVNMPQGAVQVAVNEPLNLADLAVQVGKRFVTEYKRAVENQRTATV